MAQTSSTGKSNPEPKKKVTLKEKLERLNLHGEWDFVLHLPLRYEDLTEIRPIQEATPGEDILLEGTIISARESGGWRKQFTAVLEDDTGTIQLRLMHYYPSNIEPLKEGNRIRAYGAPRQGYNGLEILHPKIQKADKPLSKTLTPIYPTTQGLFQPWLRKRIQTALMNLEIDDLLTEQERTELGLPSLKDAIQKLHNPPPNADLLTFQERTNPEWRRLKFDELLAQQIMLRRSRKIRDAARAPSLVLNNGEDSLVSRFLRSLPFSLTGAQIRCWKEISQSLQGPQPMNRLVQGDVGSGKTVIAALAACEAIDNGMQAALMAPTEILAEQHFAKILHWLEPLGIETVRLSGKMKAKEKRDAQEKIAQGAPLIIGTHALIQPSVHYKKLGLAIIDEQHRFGVLQRLALRSAGNDGLIPHLLMLSATPIPRTLAMSYLSDMDVSVIDELPPGRTPISTKLIRMDRKNELIKELRLHLTRGAQAYWVCPLVDESEKLDLSAAIHTFEELKQKMPDVSVALIHGQMTSAEKNTSMEAFSSGQVQLLVATTVIEVGVDVPNASYMVIEHVERFGLSQLHQLRGRVGRGSKESFCIGLFSDMLSSDGKQRLKIFRENTDGFEIAKLDLQMRGPGEFLGSRQSGVPLLRFADIDKDQDLVQAASKIADTWLVHDEKRALQHADRWFRNVENYLEA